MRNGVRDQNLGSWCTHHYWGWSGGVISWPPQRTSPSVYVGKCIHIYAHTHTYVHIHTKIHDCIHRHTYAHVHVHVGTHTHTYTHFRHHESTPVPVIPTHIHGVAACFSPVHSRLSLLCPVRTPGLLTHSLPQFYRTSIVL